MLPKLKQFYVNCIAPEIYRGNLAKGLKCVDPPYIVDAIKSFEEKKGEWFFLLAMDVESGNLSLYVMMTYTTC